MGKTVAAVVVVVVGFVVVVVVASLSFRYIRRWDGYYNKELKDVVVGVLGDQ